MGHGRSPYQAVQNFRSSLQRLVSCVTDSVVTIRGADYRPGSEFFLTLGEGEPVKLPGVDVALWIRHFARVVEHEVPQNPWRVSPIGYLYTLLEAREGGEIVSYQWHPAQRSLVTFPHLHLGAASRVGRDELRDAHLPTGFVGLEDVLSLAIRDLGVRPRRDDWAEILGAQTSTT